MMASLFDKANKETAELKDLISDDDYLLKIKQRSYKRQSVTKTINSIENKLPDAENDLKFNINKLKCLKLELISLNESIQSSLLRKKKLGDKDFNDFCALCETYDDNIERTLCALTSKLEEVLHPSNFISGNAPPQTSNSSLPRLKIPELKLPTFDGKPEKYKSFIVSLELVLGKFNLTDYEKYLYLKQQVTGPAKEIIESLPTDDLTFDAAKKLLSDAFSDTTIQQFSIIEQLCALNLAEDNVYSWISESRQIVEQMNRLNVTSEIFAQFFIWRNMPETYQRHFISINNTAKPTLQQILDTSFEVLERAKNDYVQSRGAHKAVTLATKVEYSGVSVKKKLNYKSDYWLCGDRSDHRILQCPNYTTPESKLQKISLLNGCTRCGLLNHQVDTCQFKFPGKCKNCFKYHAYFLCTKPSENRNASKQLSSAGRNKYEKNAGKYVQKASSSNTTGGKPSQARTSTNSCEVDVFVLNTETKSADIFLPTFTAEIPNKNSEIIPLRAMLDPASQSSFITEHALSKLNKYRIVNSNLKINISGFNEVRTIFSKSVEIQINLGENLRLITAIVVPEIRAKLPNCTLLPEIKDSFSRNNLKLADQFLGDAGVIDILVGVHDARNVPVQSCTFGSKNNPSLLYLCGAGVMLAGNMLTLQQNIPHLPLAAGFIDKFKAIF